MRRRKRSARCGWEEAEEGVRPGFVTRTERSWRRREAEGVYPSGCEALRGLSCGPCREEVEEERPDRCYGTQRREPEEPSCVRAALWQEAEVGPSDWPEQAAEAGRGCGLDCWAWAFCAASCASGAAPERPRLSGRARWSWACREGAAEGPRSRWSGADWRTRGGPGLCWASEAAASLCCASVRISDWVEAAEGRWTDPRRG